MGTHAQADANGRLLDNCRIESGFRVCLSKSGGFVKMMKEEE